MSIDNSEKCWIYHGNTQVILPAGREVRVCGLMVSHGGPLVTGKRLKEFTDKAVASRGGKHGAITSLSLLEVVSREEYLALCAAEGEVL